jgi:hypothetical protein
VAKRARSTRNGETRVGSGPAARAARQPTDLSVEYRYVLEDLERIGIIAVVLIGLLVALSFFL